MEEEEEEEEEESCQQQYVYCSDLTCTSHCSILSVVFFFFLGVINLLLTRLFLHSDSHTL